jgi:branched-chain amino acid transport system permease protein
MTLLNALAQGILLGGIFALAAAGLSLMYGVMRVTNLAHGDLMVLGGYVCALAATSAGVPVVLSAVVAMAVLGAAGWLTQRLILDRALSVGEMAPLLVTFGLSVIIPNVLLEAFTNNSKPISIGAIGTQSFQITDDIAIGWFPLIILVIAIAVVVVLQLFLRRTHLGRLLRATSDDASTVRLMGVDNRTMYGIATAIAFATVALGGSLYAMRQGGITPFEGQSLVLFAFEAVIIGGLGSLWGTLLGGFVLGIAQAVGAMVSPDLPLLVGHLVFLAVLAVRPQGILGKRSMA